MLFGRKKKSFRVYQDPRAPPREFNQEVPEQTPFKEQVMDFQGIPKRTADNEKVLSGVCDAKLEKDGSTIFINCQLLTNDHKVVAVKSLDIKTK